MKFNNPLRCPQYVGVACFNGDCPAALAGFYAKYGCGVVRDCSYCCHYRGCEDCVPYVCFPELRVVYGNVSNNYRKMHGFSLLRKKHIKKK